MANDADQNIPAIPAHIPLMIYAINLYFLTLIPDNLAASSLLPMANVYRPMIVLYIKTIPIAKNSNNQIMPVGKPLALEKTRLYHEPVG